MSLQERICGSSTASQSHGGGLGYLRDIPRGQRLRHDTILYPNSSSVPSNCLLDSSLGIKIAMSIPVLELRLQCSLRCKIRTNAAMII